MRQVGFAIRIYCRDKSLWELVHKTLRAKIFIWNWKDYCKIPFDGKKRQIEDKQTSQNPFGNAALLR